MHEQADRVGLIVKLPKFGSVVVANAYKDWDARIVVHEVVPLAAGGPRDGSVTALVTEHPRVAAELLVKLLGDVSIARDAMQGLLSIGKSDT